MLILPCRSSEKSLLITRLSRQGYAKMLEDYLSTLKKTPGLNSILADIRENPTEIDDFVSILKVGHYFVSNGASLEFIPPVESEQRPDIKITKDSQQIFIEVKRLADTTRWREISQKLSSISSGLTVDISVDFDLYEHQITEIVDKISKALANRTSTQPPTDFSINNYANVRFANTGAATADPTVVIISERTGLTIVDDAEFKGGIGELRYSDLRIIFQSRLDKALSQLLSSNGCRVVAFDIDRFIGPARILGWIFLGTPMTNSKNRRDWSLTNKGDGIFCDAKYSKIDVVIAFFNGLPERIRNPVATNGVQCLKLL